MTIINKVVLHTDGACRGNPGQSAIGVLVLDILGNELDSHKKCIGHKTNNESEYHALIEGLQVAAKHTRNEVEVFMDSELIVKQMNGTNRIKAENLYVLFQKVKDAERPFSKVIYNWRPRNHPNQIKADKLANSALDGN